jgi:Mrp family chromosome partitioning ATPase
MFNQVKVPLIRVVENMSYFVCSAGTRALTDGGRSNDPEP